MFNVLLKTSTMNEWPVIRSLYLCKDFWDHHRANIASCLKEIYGKRLFGANYQCWLVLIDHNTEAI